MDSDLESSGQTPPTQDTADEQPSQAHCQQLFEHINAALVYWRPMHRQIQRARMWARGRDISEEEDTGETTAGVRVNITHAAMGALIPHIYARNPEIASTVAEGVDPLELRSVKAVAKTLGVVLNHQLERGGLKATAKRCIKGAMVSKLAWAKVTYQRDFATDPIIRNRMNDAQDNLRRINRRLYGMQNDEVGYSEQLALKEELNNTLAALTQQVEVVVQQGLVIDRVQPEHLIVDPTIPELALYLKGRRMTERMFMPLTQAQEYFDRELHDARRFPWNRPVPEYRQVGEEATASAGRDPQVCVYETWDRESMTCYHQVVGEKDYVREPYQPDAVGERFFPYFGLWYDDSDGYLVPLSRTELIHELAREYEQALTQRAAHREVSKPHWIADAATDMNTLRTWRSRELGEVTLVDANGKPIKTVIDVAAVPPFNPQLYDVTPTLHDIDMVMGQQDAARGAVLKPKTATEASLLEQGRAGRADELRDTNEDWVSEIGIYSAEILLQELDLAEVQRIAGPQAVWPMLDKDTIFEKVRLDIRAGSSGRPDRVRDQELWERLLPNLERLMDKVQQIVMMGGDPSPYIALAKETLRRFDDSLELEEFFPIAAMLPAFQPGMVPPQPTMGGAPGMPPGMPPGAPGGMPGPGPANAPGMPGGVAPGGANVIPFSPPSEGAVNATG